MIFDRPSGARARHYYVPLKSVLPCWGHDRGEARGHLAPLGITLALPQPLVPRKSCPRASGSLRISYPGTGAAKSGRRSSEGVDLVDQVDEDCQR